MRVLVIEGRLGLHAGGTGIDPMARTGRLRQKIDDDTERPLLQTVRGAGYRLRAEA